MPNLQNNSDFKTTSNLPVKIVYVFLLQKKHPYVLDIQLLLDIQATEC